MIELTDVYFSYPEGEFSLRVPQLCIEDGETVAVIGPSGSGKTTLLHLITGIATPQTGKVVTHGVEVSGLDDPGRRDFRVRRLGLVFQEFELLEYLSVLDNILLPYRIHPGLRLERTVRDRAAELAAGMGIGDWLGRYPRSLSQGERQRVAVCRALVTGPRLLLADEPTGNLDPANKDRVLDLLFEVAEAEEATLLVVTHDHDLLGRFGRVIDFRDFHFWEQAA